jgi:hypothetical protein
MLSKAEIARYLSKEVNTSNGVLVQFFHSTFYKIGMSEDEYLSAFKAFLTDLENDLEYFKDFSIKKTHLKGIEFTTLKIPKKVLKQMELDYLEAKAYIESVIKEMNN